MKSLFFSSHAQMDLLMTVVPDSVSVSGISAVIIVIIIFIKNLYFKYSC